MFKDKLKTITVLVLILSATLNTAFLGFAADPVFTLSSSNSGGSVFAHFGGYLDVVHLTAPDQAGWDSGINIGTNVNEGRIEIPLPAGFTLGDLESISWDVWTVNGYPPHVDLLLDINEDDVFDGGKKDLVTGAALSGLDDVLVFEFAYQPYSEIATSYGYIAPGDPYGHYDPAAQSTWYNPSYGEWVETFQQTASETGTTQINDESIAWLYSGLPGPYQGGYFGTLYDFKEGTVESIVDSLPSGVTSETVVLALQIEVDNWLGDADAYVDNIAIIGHPQIDIISPEPTTYGPGDISLEIAADDVMGIKSVTYTLEKTGDPTPIINDESYTTPTTLSGLVDGEYTLTAVATNDNDLSSEKSVTFNVDSQVTVEIHPETLNLRSGGRWVTLKITLPEGMPIDEFDIDAVRLWVDGEDIEPEWGCICIDDEEHSVMVKFSRAALITALVDSLPEPDEEDKFLDVEVPIKVTGDLPGGGSFEQKDTIRVIYPGDGNMLAHQTLNRGQLKKQEKALSGNNGKGPKEDKPGKGPKGNNGNGKSKGNK